jgi:hypothetical protein
MLCTVVTMVPYSVHYYTVNLVTLKNSVYTLMKLWILMSKEQDIYVCIE